MRATDDIRVALLLSCYSFESFFGGVLGLDRDQYLKNYRNDFSWYYSKGLIENGITPILYIPSVQYEGIYKTDVGVSVRFLPFAQWFRLVAPLRRAMRATRWSLYTQERINAAAMLPSLNRALVEDGAALLYVQEYWGGRYDHLTSRVHVPVVAADHGGVARGVVKWFKRRTFGQAAALYCQTDDECRQVERYGGRPTLQPNGCDVSYFSPPPSGAEREKIIVTVARLTDKQKRTSDLIRALPLLSDDWTLNIIGTGPDKAFLSSLADELGVSPRVTFHGFQGQADIRTFNRQCGVFAMPSAHEAVCLAALEAMSCGAAIVTSCIRAFESLISDGVNGKLFPVADVPALARAIESAWNDRKILGPAAAKSVAERFNSRVLYNRLAESIRQSAGVSSGTR